MILISYVDPFIVVQSDRLITGRMVIRGETGRIYRSDEFSSTEYIHVRVKASWSRSVVVMIFAEGTETRKVINL